jgi:CRP/FNR family transcriptional regulator, cyclic AMP receptor protein
MRTILKFCQGLPEHSFDAGQSLLIEGERTGKLYILVDGTVEIVKGTCQVHVTSEPGALFGEMSTLLDVPHTATVRALAPSRVYAVGRAGEFLDANHEIVFFISKLLAQRLQSVTGYLADMKSQFEDRKDHLGIVDEVLETLLHQQSEPFVPGSDRHPDPKI